MVQNVNLLKSFLLISYLLMKTTITYKYNQAIVLLKLFTNNCYIIFVTIFIYQIKFSFWFDKWVFEMLYYDRIDLSDETDLTKVIVVIHV